MATLTMSPAVRQPFASVDGPRIRSLLKTKMNLANQQNAVSPLSLKRPAASDSDSENVDPATFGMSTKRKRSSDDDDMSKENLKPAKTSRFVLNTVESNVARKATPLSTRTSRASTPASTQIKPAGRSPQMKPRKVFGRRSVNTNRVEPAMPKRTPVSRAPFSITTALSAGKPKASSRPKPSSWFFDIHVDSEQDEMTNLMEHSTCVLDISDDEGKGKTDARGKENIPPHELGIQLASSTNVSAATARKNMTSCEPRSPLGELDATDYYADGCHSLSYAVIYDEEAQSAPEKITTVPQKLSPTKSEQATIASISSLLAATAPVKDDAPATADTTAPSETNIEIWESASATEEAAADASTDGAKPINILSS
ncbi:hypothetical protein Plec18167_007393 [Paecilomyces lecythidis]|uniref:Uncharacterized protein n=1 Tax=Paecilomyces lecythidis TaxID=3004212 RepID=A0ABR3X4G2_9EURO